MNYKRNVSIASQSSSATWILLWRHQLNAHAGVAASKATEGVRDAKVDLMIQKIFHASVDLVKKYILFCLAWHARGLRVI